MHIIWIGRWLSRKCGGLFCPKEKRREALISARELSLVFHQLNQLHLSTNLIDFNGPLLSLNAVNMAEVSIGLMHSSDLVNIYMSAALRVKKSYPKCMIFLSRYYLSNAKSEGAKRCGQIRKFQWVFTPYGYKYFIHHDFKLECYYNMFATINNKADPMSYVMKKYREHLLNKAVQILLGAVSDNALRNNRNGSRPASASNLSTGTIISNVLNYTALLKNTMSTDDDLGNNDETVSWWNNLLIIAAYWLLGEDDKAKNLYATILKLPDNLNAFSNNEKDTLPNALFNIFQAKQLM